MLLELTVLIIIIGIEYESVKLSLQFFFSDFCRTVARVQKF